MGHSPRITDVNMIPHHQFEEWLVFTKPAEVRNWEPLVNFLGWSLTDGCHETNQDDLWTQLESIQPESYLAEGDRNLIFVTSNRRFHQLGLKLKDLEVGSLSHH